MYYYYDILLNFQENPNLYEFYEWLETDDIDFIKKIPLFRISTNVLKEFLKYKVKFEEEFLNSIKNKTILKTTSKVLKNTFLVSDSKDALALELNENGEVVSRSKLLLADEINLNEMMFTMKETKLKYEKIEKYSKRKNIRQIEERKKLINCEINTLYESKNKSKLKYLYFEWFNELNNNIEEIYNRMKEDLKNDFDENQERIYHLIKKSYHKVN